MIPTILRLSIVILCSILLLESSHAQRNLASSNHHQGFDFWIGSWNVFKYGTDTLVGRSNISPILNHQAIKEEYEALNSPYRGTSTNIYNAQKDRWEQYWVDITGFTLHIKGGLENSNMVLSECDGQVCNKIVWTPLPDKTVRQEWMQSFDAGASWNKIFDGHYFPRGIQDKVVPVLNHLNTYPNIRDFTISSDGKEAYLTVQNPTEEVRTICRINQINGSWSVPVPTSFSGVHRDLEPYLSPDNLRLYFVSNRPNAFAKTNYDIYYVEREHRDSSWSQPTNIGLPINTELDEFYPAVAANGNLYFTGVKAHNNGKDDIYMSPLKNGQYQEPIAISANVNTEGYEFNSFVAPDESYIIFSGYNREDGIGSGDLYISRKTENGEWGKAENLGLRVNSRYMEYCPFVDTATNTLYFTSRRSNVDQMNLKSSLQLKQEILKYENGSSRIYKTKLNDEK